MSDDMIDTPAGRSEGGFAPPGAEDFKAPTETIKPETLPEKPKDETADSVVPDDSKDKEGSPPSPTPTPSEDVTSSEPKKTEEIKEIKRDVKIEITSTKEMIRQMLAHDRKLAHEKEPTISLIVTDDDIQKASLTLEQKKLIEIYTKQVGGDAAKSTDAPSDENIFKLVDIVREQITKEALERDLLSGLHLLPLVDEGSPLYKKLQETAFIDDPKLLAEALGDPEGVAIELAKIQMRINEIKDDPDSHDELKHLLELNKLLPKVIKEFPKILESQNITDLFKDIAEGLKPELVKGISEFSNNSSIGLAEILKELIEESGVKIDPSKLQQGFKKYGKYGLLAALGLMYALMKSGKEQPQYQ